MIRKTHFVLLAAMLGSAAMAPAEAATARRGSNPATDIRKALQAGCTAVERGDSRGAMAPFLASRDLVEYDFGPPTSKTYAQHKAETEGLMGLIVGRPTCIYLSIDPRPLAPDVWYSLALMRFAARFRDGRSMDVTFRSTDIWRRIGGQWRIVHEHNSFPVDVFTGKADLRSGQQP